MNKISKIAMVILVLSVVVSGCSPAQSTNSEELGSIYINASTYSMDVTQGEIVEFFPTITHDIQNSSTIVVRTSPASGNRWKFALCYGLECFISNGSKVIEKRIDLSPNSPMEFDVKFFVPENAKTGESFTVLFEVQSTISQGKTTVSFTAMVK
jgi:hypothetical protein